MKRSTILTLAATVAVLAASAALAGGIVNVDQKNLSFSSTELTVNKGDIVNFTNNDTTSHNILVTGNGVTLNSGLQQPGVAFKAPMVKEGVYQVVCGIHPKMKMTIRVN